MIPFLLAPPPETVTVLATIIGLAGATIAAIFILRFQTFDREMKSLKKQILSKVNKIDAELDTEIRKTPRHDKKIIKELVSKISAYESKANELEGMRSRMTGNFKFDLVSFALLALILLMGLYIQPIETAYFPMLITAMLVGFHIMNFGGTVFAYLKIRKDMEEGEESQKNGE